MKRFIKDSIASVLGHHALIEHVRRTGISTPVYDSSVYLEEFLYPTKASLLFYWTSRFKKTLTDNHNYDLHEFVNDMLIRSKRIIKSVLRISISEFAFSRALDYPLSPTRCTFFSCWNTRVKTSIYLKYLNA